MALIAALLPDRDEREALRAAAPAHAFLWASDWVALDMFTRDHAIAAVIADTGAVPRKDGVLRILHHIERYPHTPILAWAPRTTRELYRLGRAGASQVVLRHETGDASFIAESVAALLTRSAPESIRVRLHGRIPAAAAAVVRDAIDAVATDARVRDLAEAQGLSASTLERRMADWGMPMPGRLLLWLRVLHGLYWVREPGRSLESIARQLGYSSGPAFKRAIVATLGEMPTRYKAHEAFDAAVELMITECGATGAAQRAGG